MTKKCISVIGLGYVGLPLLVEFSKHFDVIGFDIDHARINDLKLGLDKTSEVSKEALLEKEILFTGHIEDLKKANFHIICVPTPIDKSKKPNIKALRHVCKNLGQVIKQNDLIIFESTVYPGLTEEVCVPILEEHSKLKSPDHFQVGYSPERMNPGDKKHNVTNIIKVVSGQNDATLEKVADLYSSIVTAGIHKASSIKVAEAAKIIENTQRDINIALMNEFAIICHKLDLSTSEVLEAASTKWNFLHFKPGLVGGHCIGVDPYYLTYKAENLGYSPQVITAGRKINDLMGTYIARETVKRMVKNKISLSDSIITVLGFTFKENCSDIRNTKVIDIINELKDFGIIVQVCDPNVDPEQMLTEYAIEVIPFEKLQKSDAIIFCVAHDEFTKITSKQMEAICNKKSLVVDIKDMGLEKKFADLPIDVWRI